MKYGSFTRARSNHLQVGVLRKALLNIFEIFSSILQKLNCVLNVCTTSGCFCKSKPVLNRLQNSEKITSDDALI